MEQKSLIKQLATSIIIPVALLLFLLLGYNVYSIQLYNEQLMEATMMSLNLYVKNITDTQKSADSFMNDIIASDTNYWYLQRRLPSVEQYSLEYELLNTLKNHMKTNRLIGVSMVYSQINDKILYFVEDGSANGPELKQYLLKTIESSSENALTRPWQALITNDGQAYISKIYGWRGAYVLLAMNIAEIPAPTKDEASIMAQVQEEKQEIESGRTIFWDAQLGALNEKDFIEKYHIKYIPSKSDYNKTGYGKYSIIGEAINDSTISMCVVRPYKKLFDSLTGIQKFLIVLSLLSIFIIPYHIWRIRRYVNIPLKRLLSEIEQVRNENISIDDAISYGSKEFNQVSFAFREMLERIKKLKIEKYESDLENQKSTLEYLKLQLRPHFFINCLKSIFAMVQNKNYDKIQDMVILVSDNVRYMFRDSLEVVTIEQELNYVKNYLRIQELGMARNVECHMQVDTEALNVKIPPLTIQTFVENSVKHGADHFENLEISLIISILKMDSVQLLDITVSDNGRGYPEEVINHFKYKIEKINSGEHVGMHNALWRLQHIYGNEMEYIISNIEGAFVELILPLNGEDGGESK